MKLMESVRAGVMYSVPNVMAGICNATDVEAGIWSTFEQGCGGWRPVITGVHIDSLTHVYVDRLADFTLFT